MGFHRVREATSSRAGTALRRGSAPICAPSGTSTSTTPTSAAPANTTSSTTVASLQPVSSTRSETALALGHANKGGAAMKTLIRLAAAGLLLAPALLSAAVSPEDAARLGADLTPLGGEKAGNADGSIPAWDGGITSIPAGYKPGDHHPDPFASETPLFTITAANVDKYADKLTAGQQALIKAYPGYSIPVYPSHRTASAPQRIYDATKRYAATAALTEGGNGISGCVVGIPFTQPENGLQVIWNHLVRYRGI